MSTDVSGKFEEFARTVEEGKPLVADACAVFEGDLEGSLEGLETAARGKRKKFIQACSNTESHLTGRAETLRSGIREHLLRKLPAARATDRPSVKGLKRVLPIEGQRLRYFRFEIRPIRLAFAAVIGAVLGSVLPDLMRDWEHPDSALVWRIVGAALVAGLFTAIAAVPIAKRTRNLLLAGGAAGAAGAVFLGLHFGWTGVLSSVRKRGPRLIRFWPVAIVVAAVIMLRLWFRKQTLDAQSLAATRDDCAEKFRYGAEADVRVLAFLAVELKRAVSAVPVDTSSQQMLDAIRAEIGRSAQHAHRSQGEELLDRLATIVGLRANATGHKAGERIRWQGTPEQKSLFRTRGIIKTGEMALITRSPVTEEVEDDGGKPRILEKGEVMPEVKP